MTTTGTTITTTEGMSIMATVTTMMTTQTFPNA